MNWLQKILNKLLGWQYVLAGAQGSRGYKTFRATKKWGVWGLKVSRKEGWNMLRRESMAADPPTLLMHGYTRAEYEIVSVWWTPLTGELAAAVLMLPEREVSGERDFRDAAIPVQPGNLVKTANASANAAKHNYANYGGQSISVSPPNLYQVSDRLSQLDAIRRTNPDLIVQGAFEKLVQAQLDDILKP